MALVNGGGFRLNGQITRRKSETEAEVPGKHALPQRGTDSDGGDSGSSGGRKRGRGDAASVARRCTTATLGALTATAFFGGAPHAIHVATQAPTEAHVQAQTQQRTQVRAQPQVSARARDATRATRHDRTHEVTTGVGRVASKLAPP